jgi:hypothetical protein
MLTREDLHVLVDAVFDTEGPTVAFADASVGTATITEATLSWLVKYATDRNIALCLRTISDLVVLATGQVPDDRP